MTITKIHLPVRLFAPSVKSRLFDPMPLPRKRAAARRARITLMSAGNSIGLAEANKSISKKLTFKVKKVPSNA